MTLTSGFDWRHFLHLAKKLDGHVDREEPSPESVDRTAVGRAYYAAYNASAEYVRSQEPHLFSGRKPKHAEISGWFQTRGGADKTLKKIGDNLARLYTERYSADYKATRHNPCTVVDAIYWAETVYRKLAEKQSDT